jgi:hypothetical protein
MKKSTPKLPASSKLKAPAVKGAMKGAAKGAVVADDKNCP